jgi:outer membrane protein
MKNSILKKILLALAAATVLSVNASAQTKIAVVDMKKAFEQYYKTKQAEAQIKSQGSEADKVYKGMLEDYKKANQEYKTFLDGSNDQAVSAEEREKRKNAAEKKLVDLQEIEKSVRQYEKSAKENIGALEKRMRDKIVDEIREVVNRLSKNGNFTMVFDLAAVTAYQTQIILYTDGQNDLTEAVVKELNATAPAGASTTGDAKAGATGKK